MDQHKGFLIGGVGGRSLGGGLGAQAGFGRKLRGLKTTSADLPDYVERVVRRWLTERTDGETFAAWVLRADENADAILARADRALYDAKTRGRNCIIAA